MPERVTAAVDDESVKLLAQYQNGDSDVAEEIFHRYVNRLVGLARKRISEGLGQRIDAEDVVQSVYRSFFRNAEAGKYAVERSGDLWRLLASITVNKVRKKARFHGQQKRAYAKEGRLNDEQFERLQRLAEGPDAADAIAVLDELESMMTGLEARDRQVLELRLQGASLEEIADKVERSQRTVRRSLDQAGETLRRRLTNVS